MSAPRSPGRAPASPVVHKPEGCLAEGPCGTFDVYARTDGVLVVVDTRIEAGNPGRVVAECVDLAAAKSAAKAFALRGDL